MKIIMGEKFLVLFIANAIVNENQPVAIFHQQTPQSPGAQIPLIGRVELIPDGLGNYAKHGTPIEFEIAGIDYM